MVRFLSLLFFLLYTSAGYAQEQPPAPPVAEESVPVVEVMAGFPGGPEALYAFIAKEVKYPKKARKAGIQGRVIVSFVVEKDGSITNVEVAHGVDPLLDAEAVRAVQAMPRWKPGEQNGKPVKVKFNLPVNFKLG